jgi:hypothetical protein
LIEGARRFVKALDQLWPEAASKRGKQRNEGEGALV